VGVPSKDIAYFTPGGKLKALINRDAAQPDLPMMSELPTSVRCLAVRDPAGR